MGVISLSLSFVCLPLARTLRVVEVPARSGNHRLWVEEFHRLLHLLPVVFAPCPQEDVRPSLKRATRVLEEEVHHDLIRQGEI